MTSHGTTTRSGGSEMPARERGTAALILIQAAASRAQTGLFAERSPAALLEANARYQALASGRRG